GFLVAAAFIGPGTVTTCSMAGARFGYALIFALVFATLTTLILQEMTGRLSLGSGRDLGQALREFPQRRLLRTVFIVLTLFSITFGCAAYEAGNIIGGALGLEMVSGIPKRVWVILLSAVAAGVLGTRKYRVVEKFLMALVFLMSASFLITCAIVKPDLLGLLKGLIPSVPQTSGYLVLALIGTTVVPYNLFLHSAAVRVKWGKREDIHAVRKDLLVSISLGGLISAAIVVTSAAAFYGKGFLLESGAQMAQQLRPLFGSLANFLFGLGFFAAGMSSAVTAPYAAAFAASGVCGWKQEQERASTKFRAVWIAVLTTGLVVSLFDLKPLAVIVAAQAANGLILPIASLFLLIVLNNRTNMGLFVNTRWQNVIGSAVILIVSVLGLWNIIKIFL
ncbi:MAG: Nramp family divalent metal transporter, partial [Candidatus Aminicenantales bacterium]